MKVCSDTYTCPVEATIHLIGGKYKAVILWHLRDQVQRTAPAYPKSYNQDADTAAQGTGKRRPDQPYGLPGCASKNRVRTDGIRQNASSCVGVYVRLGAQNLPLLKQLIPKIKLEFSHLFPQQRHFSVIQHCSFPQFIFRT